MPWIVVTLTGVILLIQNAKRKSKQEWKAAVPVHGGFFIYTLLRKFLKCV